VYQDDQILLGKIAENIRKFGTPDKNAKRADGDNQGRCRRKDYQRQTGSSGITPGAENPEGWQHDDEGAGHGAGGKDSGRHRFWHGGEDIDSDKHLKVLLMGNPNVGKSVLFSRLTGIHVISANYPGTTVGYTQGHMVINGKQADVIDVPGTYTLEPTNEAERIAAEMVKDGDIIVNVVDATNLERNLYLTLQLLELHKPTIIALNLWDDTKHRGIDVDLQKLHMLLAVPVIPTSATSGWGVKELVEAIPRAAPGQVMEHTREARWAAVGSIVHQVQRITHRHHRFTERLADASVRPLTGSIMALFVLVASFAVVRLIGEGLIKYALDPLFNLWGTVMMKLSAAMGGQGFFHDVIVGRLIDGQIDFKQSLGLLTTGLYVEFNMVLPYVLAFYLVLGILEDTGYLPRLAVLMDSLLHRIGLHGYAIIPTMLGLGCNVPAIISTRILESKRERFIAATLISIAVPCAALQAMIVGLAGKFGIQYVALIYGILFLVWVLLGFIINKVTGGFSPELLTEIPPYRLPPLGTLGQKLWMRVLSFIKEALPVVMGGVFVLGILYSLGVFDAIARVTAPVITGVFGLPKEAVTAVIVGFIRKDVAMGMLTPLSLTANQMVVASIVLAMSFPCIATFVILIRELGWKDMLKSAGIMLVVTLGVGGLVHLILR
jgi:ferrous iron transport protein B